MDATIDTMNDKIVCKYCGTNFSARKHLYHHVRRQHKTEPFIQSRASLKCAVDDCSTACSTIATLRNHMQEHQIKLEMEKKSFQTLEDFQIWKAEEEKNTLSSFVKPSGSKVLASGSKKTNFRCNRSGNFISKSTGKRSMWSQGSSKIGVICPASMEMELHTDGTVFVEYWYTHCAHDKDLSHIRLSDNERAEISGKLCQGVSMERVLDDIRNTISSKLERSHLVTRKDLHNITRDFDTCSEKQNYSDVVSVAMWVENMKKLGDQSPVIFYKEQDSPSADGIPLSTEDIMLVIMTPAQKVILQQFGNDRVCADGTHGTNGYDFILHTLLIVDDFGHGFPAAYCISNKSTQTAMTVFFNAIKEKVGVLNARIFMTDDAPSYVNAWTEVMNNPERHLLCSWHVDRNWRKQIHDKVKGTAVMKACVYKAVRTLLVETDKKALNVLLPLTINSFLEDVNTKEFGLYFRSHYASRVEQWAYSHRSEAGINTNMRLEAMHRVLKDIYFSKKKVKRLDKCLLALMKMTRDKVVGRIRNICWQANSESIRAIKERHSKSLTIPVEDIEKVKVEENFIWNVKSQRIRQELYTVRYISECKSKTCRLKCDDCVTKVCVHMYSCTCVDFLVLCGICKHIHAVVNITVEQHEKEEEVETNTNVVAEVEALASALVSVQDIKPQDKLVRDTLTALQVAAGLLEKPNLLISKEKLLGLNSCLLTFINSIGKENRDAEFKMHEDVAREPANKKRRKQIRFHSTKKRREGPEGCLMTKPTASEQNVFKTLMLNACETAVNIVDVRDDHCYSSVTC